MRRVHPRRASGVAVVLLAAGLLAAPGAAAGTVGVADPKAVPSPGFAGTGVRTDACDDTTAPGWIEVAAPELTVTAASPRARFALWDESTPTGDKILDSTVDTGADGIARLRTTGLADGHTYAWRAWPENGPGAGEPTAKCHFRVDTTRPTLVVASTDFPETGSGATPVKYAGETGTFTLTGLDAAPAGGLASGVACYQYVLNGVMSVGWDCTAPSSRVAVAAADGSATLKLKPKDWGANVLTVQAMDQAGNVGQPVTYSFYAPSDPRPKPIVPGDVDGDSVPDILLPDAAGGLQIISAAADSTTPSSVLPAALAPGGAGWQDAQVLHRGWGNFHAPGDDLLVRSKADPDVLYSYINYNAGDFSNDYTSPVWKPTRTDCYDATANAIECPVEYTDDWASADQLVALGGRGDATDPSWPVLVSVEDGKLWVYYSGFRDYFAAQTIATTADWSSYELIAPGADANGNLTLWARERATGVLHTYAVPKDPNGLLDFSALTDPSAGAVASGFTVEKYPTLGSSGDGNGDGRPDLWAVTVDRHLVTFDGWSLPKDLGILR